MALRIGVLAVQGAFVEHIAMLESLGVETIPIRLPEDVADLDGLILPGGESTAISRLIASFGLLEPLRQAIDAGTPVYGTCAGMILLARDIGAAEQPILGMMDIVVRRNAFGRQLASFKQDVALPALGDRPFPAIFIRAPAIERTGQDVHVVSRLQDGTIIAAEQAWMLATAFHPELSGDTRLHQHFIAMCEKAKRGDSSLAGAEKSHEHVSSS